MAHPAMNILYHLTILPPAMPGCDAVVQEVETLQGHFGGTVVYLNPNDRFPLHLPRATFGMDKLAQIRRLEADYQVHHVFNPDPFAFPVLRGLRRPIIYSLTGGVGSAKPNLPFFSSLAAVTVADERSLKRLESWGLDNVSLVHPGIDLTPFTCSPISLSSDIRLMVGSAPWNRAQFQQKGIDALLSAAGRTPQLYLVFLWRGVLADEMERRVGRLELKDRVTILNRRVNVNKVLAGVHASVSLAADPAVIRPYPHSLIESLAASKPVVLSECIPMADYVERTGCGIVVENVSVEKILAALESLTSDYDRLQRSARQVGQRDFTQKRLIASYRRVYERVLGRQIDLPAVYGP